jgi:hypothetical protein
MFGAPADAHGSGGRRVPTGHAFGGSVNNSSAAIPPVQTHVIDESLSGSAHWWFSALDQRWFAIAGDRWLTQVVGVHEDGGDVWIQMQTLGEKLRDFTICVRHGMSMPDVVRAIESQLTQTV